MCWDVQAMLLRQLLLETQVSFSLSLSSSAHNDSAPESCASVPCALCKDDWLSSAVWPWPSIEYKTKTFLMLVIQQKDEGQHQQSI